MISDADWFTSYMKNTNKILYRLKELKMKKTIDHELNLNELIEMFLRSQNKISSLYGEKADILRRLEDSEKEKSKIMNELKSIKENLDKCDNEE